MKKLWSLFLVGVLFSVWACSTDNGGENPIGNDDDVSVTFDRGPLLQNWADNIILPSYGGFQSALSGLKSNFDNFKDEPNEENLVLLRSSWLGAYKAWQQVSLFEIGPAETLGLRLNVNTYPTDTDALESNVSSGEYNLSLPSSRDTKGFPAMDYLINGLRDNDAEIVAVFQSDTAKDAYLSYFEDVINDMVTLVDQVVVEWNDSFRDDFVANDGSSSTASVDRFVNDYIFYYEKFLRAGKMGIPLGVFTGTTAPDRVEAYFKADVSKELFLAGLDATQDFFNGKHYGSATTGKSLASYLQDLNSVKDGEALDVLINEQFNSARDMIEPLGTFRDEIENNNPPTNMLLAYDEVQRIVPLFKVDMVSAMSISIDFVDADGD